MRVIKNIEKRKFNYGCGVVTQNFLMSYSLFKITVKSSKKVDFSSEKQKDMSDDSRQNRPDLFTPSFLIVLRSHNVVFPGILIIGIVD